MVDTEIEGIIQRLTKSSIGEQADAISDSFLPDAAYVHPFCRVPSLQDVTVPWLGTINSRMIIWFIFKWSRMVSPETTVDVRSSGMLSFPTFSTDVHRLIQQDVASL
jgi:hypothetical protein